MKALILIISLVIASVSVSVAQTNLFGVNISKYADAKEDLVYRKLDCAKNPYYTFAEYKSYPKKNMKFIMFDDFGAKEQTAQMLDPKSYLANLSSEISKTFGQDFKVYKDANLTDPINDQYYWIIKENNKFIVAKLFYSTFSQRNNLRIFIFDDENELAFGFANLTKAEGKNNNLTMFYSEEEVLSKVTKSTNGVIFTKF